MAATKFNDFVSAGAATLGVVTTAVSAYAAFQANSANVSATKAQIAANDTKSAFEEIKYKDEQQSVLNDKIEALILTDADGKSRGVSSLVLAATYVSMIRDAETQGIWCGALVSYARVRPTPPTPAELKALTFARNCVRDEEAAPISPADEIVQNAAEGPTAPVLESALGASETAVIKTNGSPIGWDVDVFACSSVGPSSRDAATAVANNISALAGSGGRIGSETLGRVRIRVLNAEQEVRYSALRGDEVRADDIAAERLLATALAQRASAAAGRPFRSTVGGSGTSWYLSIFTCARA